MSIIVGFALLTCVANLLFSFWSAVLSDEVLFTARWDASVGWFCACGGWLLFWLK